MLSNKIVKKLKRVFSNQRNYIALHEPELIGNELAYLEKCIRSTFVSYIGEYVDKFEKMLADYTHAKRAVATVNGTAALHLALMLAGVRPNDEVLMPSFTFVATANAVSYINAVPHFVDSEEQTLGVDPLKLMDYLSEIARVTDSNCYNRLTGRRLSAFVPMHTFGHPVDLDPLVEICSKYHIVMVEDAAESLGSLYKGRHTGTFGRCGILSFNGNKIITTGGGGAIITNDEQLANEAKYVSTTAKVPHKWCFYHDRIGYNYRMPNINAAVGCAQIERLSDFIERKRELAALYQKIFCDVEEVTFFSEPEFARSNYWLNTLILKSSYIEDRDDILEVTNQEGLFTRPIWTPMHKLPMYVSCPKMSLETCQQLEEQIINIPSSPKLLMKKVY